MIDNEIKYANWTCSCVTLNFYIFEQNWKSLTHNTRNIPVCPYDVADNEMMTPLRHYYVCLRAIQKLRLQDFGPLMTTYNPEVDISERWQKLTVFGPPTQSWGFSLLVLT